MSRRSFDQATAIEHSATRKAAAADFRAKAAAGMKAAAERKAALQAAMTKRQGRLARSMGAASAAMLASRKASAAPTFNGALEKFKAHAQKQIDDYYAKHFPTLKKPTLHYSDGDRYVRVTRVDYGGKSGSAHAFIDKRTGDVLKPDGYKRPAKGARGNIFTGQFGVNAHGANYSEHYMRRRGG